MYYPHTVCEQERERIIHSHGQAAVGNSWQHCVGQPRCFLIDERDKEREGQLGKRDRTVRSKRAGAKFESGGVGSPPMGEQLGYLSPLAPLENAPNGRKATRRRTEFQPAQRRLIRLLVLELRGRVPRHTPRTRDITERSADERSFLDLFI